MFVNAVLLEAEVLLGVLDAVAGEVEGDGAAGDDPSHVFVGGGLDAVVDGVSAFREGFLDLSDFFGVVDLNDGFFLAVYYSDERR